MSIDLNHPDFIDLKSRIRENSKEFVVIAGAGLSRKAGLPNWPELRDILVDDARKRISEIPDEEKSGYISRLDRISNSSNLWLCFKELKEILTNQAYIECIKKSLSVQDKSKIPPIYNRIWQLNIKGILTYNIDTCAIDSFSRVNHSAVDSATGKEQTKFAMFLSGPQQFVFQPHGHVSDSSTWVFTSSEMHDQLNFTAYLQFMQALCQTKHLLILGFNPSDFAFQFLIQKALITSTSTGSKHYVFLPTQDTTIIKDFGDKGFSVIPYHPTSPDHPEVLDAIEEILKFLPKDSIAASVYEGQHFDIQNLPDDSELMHHPVDQIRKILNGAIASIIPPNSSPNQEDIDKLEDFYKDHIQAIHNAWLIHPKSHFDLIHDFKVLKEIGRGAFGQVYEAERISTKERVAVKVLLPEVKNNREYLNSFRIGVRSMRILTERQVPKMVKFIDAFEIPACVIMEFIDGPTLTEAKESKQLKELSDCLSILVQVGRVVLNAHNLEERVLHRDLKPDNVILKNFYVRGNEIEVIVLDFDLSWHKGALELSVVHGARAQGYAAPEQTASVLSKGISTRNTAVDVFGYGMLAFFTLLGENPRPNEHKFKDFKQSIISGIKKSFSEEWKCIPAYLANTIVGCTHDNQTDRIPFSVALDAFNNAFGMCFKNIINATNPILLYEIAERLEPDAEYRVTEHGRRIEVKCHDKSKKILLQLVDYHSQPAIYIELTKVRTESEQRNIAKYLDRAKERAVSKLHVQPFINTEGIIGHSMLSVKTFWPLDSNIELATIDKMCQIISEAKIEMQLN